MFMVVDIPRSACLFEHLKPPCTFKDQVVSARMNAYVGMEMQLHLFLTSVQGGSGKL